MPKTLSPLDALHHDITEALAELRGARADYTHSPNADTQRTVEYAEWRLDKLTDKLLDRRHAAMQTAPGLVPARR